MNFLKQVSHFLSKYRVMVEGKNVLIKIEGAIVRFGFFTTRFVRAYDKNSAAQFAIELVEEELINYAENAEDDPFILQIEEINRMGIGKYFFKSGKGFTFYSESKDDNFLKDLKDKDAVGIQLRLKPIKKK